MVKEDCPVATRTADLSSSGGGIGIGGGAPLSGGGGALNFFNSTGSVQFDVSPSFLQYGTLLGRDCQAFTVHVGNTYSQVGRCRIIGGIINKSSSHHHHLLVLHKADYHVESLLEVRRLLRDFASISFRQMSKSR